VRVRLRVSVYPCGGGGAGGHLGPAAVPTGKSVLFLVGNCIGSDQKDGIVSSNPRIRDHERAGACAGSVQLAVPFFPRVFLERCLEEIKISALMVAAAHRLVGCGAVFVSGWLGLMGACAFHSRRRCVGHVASARLSWQAWPGVVCCATMLLIG
jgi:hypothetical protein